MKYIVTKFPSTIIGYNWTVKDSFDGVVYDSFDEALVACIRLGGAGVTRLSEEN